MPQTSQPVQSLLLDCVSRISVLSRERKELLQHKTAVTSIAHGRSVPSPGTDYVPRNRLMDRPFAPPITAGPAHPQKNEKLYSKVRVGTT